MRNCVLSFVTNLENTMATMTTTTTTTSTTTSADPFLQTCALDNSGSGQPDLTDTTAYLASVFGAVMMQCSSGASCKLSPPGTSITCASSAYYPATDATGASYIYMAILRGLVTGAEKDEILVPEI